MRVYGYVRVSTAEQAGSGESLETQRRQVEAWAMLKGWSLTDIMVEAGVSGSIPLADRPGGKRLLQAVSKGDVVITPKLDRMFRSASDALGTLEELKEVGVDLVMIDLGGSVTNNGLSKMVFTILAAVAEGERDRIRERIRDVKRRLASEGVYNGGKRPFGFDVVNGRLVRNEAEQAQLVEMKAMRAAGKSFRVIADTIGSQPMTVKRILDRAGASR